MHIQELSPGDRVSLVSFGATDIIYRRRLLVMGITYNTPITLLRIAPLGCPLQISVRGTILIIRKHEARHLVWEHVHV